MIIPKNTAKWLRKELMRHDIMKWLIEVLDDEGNWKKFNFFEGETHQVKQKMADVLSVTRYLGIKCSKV